MAQHYLGVPSAGPLHMSRDKLPPTHTHTHRQWCPSGAIHAPVQRATWCDIIQTRRCHEALVLWVQGIATCPFPPRSLHSPRGRFKLFSRKPHRTGSDEHRSQDKQSATDDFASLLPCSMCSALFCSLSSFSLLLSFCVAAPARPLNPQSRTGANIRLAVLLARGMLGGELSGQRLGLDWSAVFLYLALSSRSSLRSICHG